MAEVEFHVEGHEAAILGIRGVHGLRDQIVEILREALGAAEATMKAMVPRGDYPHDPPKLAETIRSSGIVFRPGGPGGGGFWEAELVAGEGIPYLNIAVEGRDDITAGWPPRAKPFPDWIPREGRRVMKFIGRGGEEVFRKRVSGYEEDDDWIVAAHHVANQIIRSRIEALDTLAG